MSLREPTSGAMIRPEIGPTIHTMWDISRPEWRDFSKKGVVIANLDGFMLVRIGLTGGIWKGLRLMDKIPLCKMDFKGGKNEKNGCL